MIDFFYITRGIHMSIHICCYCKPFLHLFALFYAVANIIYLKMIIPTLVFLNNSEF